MCIRDSFQHVVCVSQVIKDSIIEVIGNPGNLVVCYNPLNQSDILNKAAEPVEDIHRSQRPLFVTVGRLNLQKGYDILLEVCNLLNKEGYEYDVWILSLIHISLGWTYFKLWLPSQNTDVLYVLGVITVFGSITEGVAQPLYYVNTRCV